MDKAGVSRIAVTDAAMEDMLRINKVFNRFKAAWENAERPRIEDFLSEVIPDARADFVRELLDFELRFRRDKGETPVKEHGHTSRE